MARAANMAAENRLAETHFKLASDQAALIRLKEDRELLIKDLDTLRQALGAD